MQEEVGSSSVLQVCFPSTQAAVLDSLNQQREDGRLCDLAIHVQGHVFKAHRCVLAASSPYFHDQVLLKNMSTVSIPAVMDPLAFESVLSCAYTGQLRMLRDDIVNYLTVGSVLQMWHIVDKCTELLKEGRAAGGGASGGGSQASRGGVSDSIAGGSGDSLGQDQAQPAAAQETSRVSQPPSRPSVSESQSPSSTNYFSPRDGGGGGTVAAVTSVEGGVASNTPSYCTPSGEEAFMIEEDEEDEVYHQKKRRRGGGGGDRKRKKTSSVSEEEVSDSFGVSSYQDGEDSSASPLQKRPAYIQPSIMPRKQWVVVKTERAEDDDDLIVVSGEEEEEDEDEDERGVASGRERDGGGDFGISHVRTLSAEAAGRAESDMDAQMDYCQSSEDFLKFEGSLLDPTLAQHLHDNNSAAQSQNANRAVSALLGQVPVAATARTQLFPLDMQGNQVLVYGQTSGLSLDGAPPPLGVSGGMMVGASYKSPSVEHGPAHPSVQGSLASEGADGSGASLGKVFMCHCGKTFTHKSMRDRHINMHLDLRPFHCPVCPKKFKMKHHLTEHMKTHTGLKPYDCAGCGRKFMWRDSFMRHRSHCERRGGTSQGGEGGPRGGRGGGGGEDVSDLIPANHLFPPGEGGLCGGGRGVMSAPSPRLHHAAVSASGSGVAAVTPGQGSGMFGGLALSHSVCSDRVCEVGANDSVT
ncbi:zinc finger and BTB domain-containing protein 22b [Dunckerocampus dactyliophorus]|uniref:zinc finger and BTB domain-containing protein 22b n=1 Tax=Dunckerocampus dactyliophorus TaxID=161453 RepID=UPI002405CBD4|nr:zinc finger and BTB domain-containing protein 22b [Dunckerocampus dactyliophorus]